MERLKCIIWSGRIQSFTPSSSSLSTIGVLLVLILAGSAHPATNTVISLADNGVGSLREVIGNSIAGDAIVWGVTGTITLTSGELVVGKNLAILGPGSAALVISGNASSRIFNINPNVTALISNLTIRGGRARDGTNGIYNGGYGTAGGPGESGGGILNLGSLILQDCTVTANRTGKGGNGYTVSVPGAYAAGGDAGSGGGIYNAGTLRLSNCVVTANATGSGGGSGGGLTYYPSGGNGGSGGGICNAGTLIVQNSTIHGNGTGNGADNPLRGPGSNGGDGAGIWNSGTLTVDGCTFSGNTNGAGGKGGVSDMFGGPGGNGGNGGGICNSGTARLTNCTFASNVAGYGGPGGAGRPPPVGQNGSAGANGYGAGLSSTNNLEMVNCTISTNQVGGGLVNFGGSVCVLNSIIAGNFGSPPDVSGSFLSLGGNLVGTTNGSSGFSGTREIIGSILLPINPMLGPLTNNGGLTCTMALLANSPTINAGVTVGAPETDQRGVNRPQGSSVDIGSFEFQFSTPQITGARFQSGSEFLLQVCGMPNHTYTVQTSTNLLNWSDVTNISAGSNGVCEWVDSNLSDRNARFYRLKSLVP